MYIYIYIYIYKLIIIIINNYIYINIHKLKKLPLLRIAFYELYFSVVYLYLVALLYFFYNFFLHSGLWCELIIVLSHFVLFFKANLKK